jgi:lysozyme family protein
MATETDFENAFAFTVGVEGNLSTDPNDPGNYYNGKLIGTKYGISAAVWGQSYDIPNLTLDEARFIYRTNYWNKSYCDLWPPALAKLIFDEAVNQGVSSAIENLQKSVGLSNIDGIVGRETTTAVSNLLYKYSTPGKGECFLILRYLANRITEYTSDSNWSNYGAGWMNRVSKLLLFVGE